MGGVVGFFFIAFTQTGRLCRALLQPWESATMKILTTTAILAAALCATMALVGPNTPGAAGSSYVDPEGNDVFDPTPPRP